MSESSQTVACDVCPIKNGWKILCGGVRIALASSLGTALSKISRLSTRSGVHFRVRIFKKDGSFDTETSSFSPESIQVPDATYLRHQGEDGDAGISLREKIALLAYSYWEKRGRRGGSPEEDWQRAEREVLNQL